MVPTTHVVVYALHTSSPYRKHKHASSHSGAHMTAPPPFLMIHMEVKLFLNW